MKNFTRAWLCLLVSFFSLSLAYGQQQMVFNSIQEKAAIANQLTEVNPFQESSFKSSNPAAIPATLTEAKTLSFEPKILDAVLRNNPAVFELSVPSPYGTLQLLLEPAELFASGFTVNSSDGVKDHDIKLGQFYRGVVKGDDNSLVSLSFINGEVQGMIATQDANLTLGKLKQEKSAQPVYIIYNEKQVETSFPNFCSTQDLPNQKLKIEPVPQGQKSLSNCVTVYFELDYDVFQNKGSVTAATNYIAAVFNEVATLYANESINVKISEVFVWNTSSPYSGTSSTTNLNQFRSTRPNFNGDIGHLIDLRPNNGGIAYVDVICNSNYNYAYSGIYSYYSNVPTYSWTVEVITHEIGHNLGSPHTHSCSWPGGPIDNCYQPDGVCTPGPAPQNGGTIMSYCHLTSHGINFNNGFGPLPGDLIRNRVSNASCLDVC
ncbi:MAG: M12 family metallo-peptidase, partial [Luteibaculum sp.]